MSERAYQEVFGLGRDLLSTVRVFPKREVTSEKQLGKGKTWKCLTRLNAFHGYKSTHFSNGQFLSAIWFLGG